ncbi:MAG: hypothetical protein RLZZ611_2504 [Cyanobacteriota bacterium]|jgi:hypothetical protein
MTQALSGAAIAAVLAVFWLLGRPRTRLLSTTDTSAVAALNRTQMERLLDPAAATGSEDAAAATPAALHHVRDGWPRDSRGRALLLRHLQEQFQQGGPLRRQAIATCVAWRNRATLPLIRRGLRDSDPAVVALAAEAMVEFRGRTSASGMAMAPAAHGTRTEPQPVAKPPSNVSRTR